MSASFPKSDSTTSLLKSSRRSTHLPEQTSELRRGQHHHQHQHQHHHRPAALHGTGGKAEESFWSAEGDVSARRPLCHPSAAGGQDGSNTAATRGKCKPQVLHGQVQPGPDCEADRGVTERSRTNPKPSHRHHHHHHHHRRKHHHGEDHPDDPERPHAGCHTHTHRVPSLSDSTDDRAPLCEPRDRKRASLARGGGQASSPSPSSLLPCPAVQQVVPPLPEVQHRLLCL
ncbi:histidine-rich glycoprotein-like [Fundulus heteroclitus]|uniref:histidine-rich glycoprotein-like n=1 Tax=Fundulus heteroclitus TaxID=8078 RepID=UPI00165B3F25|nr:histidine-rich glycoprotein-like [Fundulus heteroclitus]